MINFIERFGQINGTQIGSATSTNNVVNRTTNNAYGMTTARAFLKTELIFGRDE